MPSNSRSAVTEKEPDHVNIIFLKKEDEMAYKQERKERKKMKSSYLDIQKMDFLVQQKLKIGERWKKRLSICKLMTEKKIRL